jgi:protein-S-isoprenylcysteine O-methyltransferase Ste14
MRTSGYTTETVLILSTSAILSNWPAIPVPNDTDFTTRLGGWLFRHRTSLAGPVALVIVMLPGSESASPFLVGAGVAITIIGELIRLWGVHHIGAISRTRSERLGPLVASGPFALVRNPLYVGNIVLWVGFAIAARMLWLAPIILVLLALEYHAIVRWEETLLESRLGQAYREYTGRVPRWIPSFNRGDRGLRRAREGFSWSATLFSERGTLLAIAAGYLLLWIKAQL